MCSPPFASNIAARYLGDEAFLVVGAAQFLQPLHHSEVDHLVDEGLRSEFATYIINMPSNTN